MRIEADAICICGCPAYRHTPCCGSCLDCGDRLCQRFVGFPPPVLNSNVFICARCARPMEMIPVDWSDPPRSLADACPDVKAKPWTTNATCSCGSDEWTTTEQDQSGWWRPLVIRPGILAQLGPFAPPDPNDRQVWRDFGTCQGRRAGWRFRQPGYKTWDAWCSTEDAALREWAEVRGLA